jgi:hypothetical protein
MMENISILTNTGIAEDINVLTYSNEAKFNSKLTVENPVINNLIAEGGESFFNYLSMHGLANENNMLVLSSKHHYYYDPNELKSVTTLINIKKLNLIKHLDSFLQSVVHVLSPKTNFIGCFSDWKRQEGVGLTSRMYKGFINFLDSKIDIEIDKNGVSKLLESHGFKIIDMTEINGLTYFRAQNYGPQVN